MRKVLLLLVFMAFSVCVFAQSTANYAFSTNATGSLALDANGNTVDMTTGTTLLVNSGLDATASTVSTIGFNFYFMGQLFTQYSVQEDGIIQLGSTTVGTNIYTITGGTTTSPRLGAFVADMRTGTTTGKIHSKLVGTSPNRALVIEFKDMMLFYNSTAGAGTSTFQVRLYETGMVEYVYGTMSATDVATTAANRAPSIGFYVGSASGSFASVTYSSYTSSTTSPYTANPIITATGAIPELTSASNGSRRVFSFTPPVGTAADPVSFNVINIGSGTSTIEWTDNSTSESFFTVGRSTSPSGPFTTVGSVTSTTTGSTGTTYSLFNNGMLPSTTYYYQIKAGTEAAPLPAVGLTGNFTTGTAGTYTSITNGNWSSSATWDAGIVPSPYDNVTIGGGNAVTIDVANSGANNLDINGTLAYASTPSSFVVNGNLTIIGGSAFNVFSGTTGKTLTLAGNLQNDGTIDLSKSGSVLSLVGTTPQSISGGGTFTSSLIAGLTFNNTSTTYPSITWGINGIMVSGTMTFTAGRIAITGNWLSCGTASATGTLSYTAGGILSGTFGRGMSTGSVAIVTASADPTSTTSRYPFINSAGANRSAFWDRVTTGATAGILGITYTEAAGLTNVSIVDATPAYTVNKLANDTWTPSVLAGTCGGTYEFAITAPNLFGGTPLTYPRLVQASAVIGTNQAGTTTPTGQRNTLSIAQLTSGAFYLGVNSADITMSTLSSGDWNSPSTWSTGAIPTCNDVVSVLNGHTVTVNSAGNVSKNLTVALGGTLTISSGDLTVGCTLNNTPFTNNGTLNVNGGIMNINGNMTHNSGSTFNQTAGDIIIDGNANGNTANSVLTGTNLLRINTNLLNLVGGKITIVDPHAGTSTSDYALGYSTSALHYACGIGHTIQFGNGTSTDPGGHTNGFYNYLFVGTGYLTLGNVIVNIAPGTNRFVKTLSNIGILGDLTITQGEYQLSSTTYVAGNIVNNGTLTSTATLGLATWTNATVSASANLQSITGTGTFRNLAVSATANFTGLTINNTNPAGFTLNAPATISGTLTLTTGIVNTTATNYLQLIAGGTISGTPSATNMIVGPFYRTFAASRTASGTYNGTTLFPVGKGTSYLPIYLDPTTTSGGAVTFKAEAFTSNSGTGAAGVSGLSTNRWEAFISSGAANLTGSFLSLSDNAVTSTSSILQSTSAAGTYSAIAPASVAVTGTPGTITTTGSQISVAAYNGYFAFGTLTPCTAPADQPSNLVASLKTTTSFTGTFNAAPSTPSHYLVVRYASGGTPTAPTNSTNYLAGNALGTGTVVYSGVNGGSTTTFTQSGLTAGTTYDYYFYSYNNSGCAGPIYNTSSPYMSSVATCATAVGAPGTPVASALSTTGFTATWTASSTSGVSYEIDISTNSGFTTFIPGYQAKPLSVGTLSEVVSGLSASSTYYVRVRAANAGCYSSNSSTLTASTLCNPTTVPYTQDFESVTTPALPTCSITENLGSGNNWTTSSPAANGFTTKALTYAFNSSNAANTWFYTQGLNLTGGTLYAITYRYGNNSTSFTERLKVAYGTSSASAAMTNSLADHASINTGVAATNTVFFTPSSTTTYYFGFNAYSTANQWNLYVDDIAIDVVPACTTPTAQPTALTFPSNGVTSIGGSFTAASPAPSGYLVVRYAAGATPTTPVNATTYTTGNTIGAGTVVSSAAGTTFSATGLTPLTTYDFYVYSFNNTICTGGPIYNTVSPLFGSSTTIGATTYVWQGTTNDYALASNWSPARNSPTVYDILQVDGSVTPSTTLNNIPTQSVYKLDIINNATVTLNAATASNTLTLASDGAQTAISVPMGSVLNVGTATSLNLAFGSNSGQLGSIVGTLNMNGASGLTLTNGITTVSGTLSLNGTSTVSGSSTTALVFTSTGKLLFTETSGTIPTATYNVNSIVEVTGITSGTGLTTPVSLGGLTWNCPSQTGAFTLASTVTTINGPLNIISTGTGSFQTGTTGTTIVTVNGNATLTAGTWNMSGNQMTINGNLILNGGTLLRNTTTAVTFTANSITQAAANTISGGTASNGISTLTAASGNTVLAGTVNGGTTGSVVFGFSAAAGNQTFTSSAATISNLLGILVNKTAGNVLLQNNFTIGAILTLTSGNLDLNGNTLIINGTVASTGTGGVKGSTTSNVSIGGTGAMGTLRFDQTTDGTTNILNSFTLNRLTSGTATLGSKLVVLNTATITAGTLTTGGFLTLRSNSLGTARIPAIGGTISGTVTVETYIPGGRRAFRFLGHPFSTALDMTSLKDNIFVTGAGAGFDATSTNNPSSYWYDNVTNAWTAFTSSTDASWTQYRGARVLVRGDRTQAATLTGGADVPNAVTLDVTGTLNTGAANVSMPTAGNYHLVSNPYPSPTDIGTVIDAQSATVGTQYWVWDANASTKGAYVVRTVGSGAYNLAMGGSFIAQPTGATTLAFTEANKTGTATSNLFRTNPKGLLELQLMYNNYPADNLFVKLNDKSNPNKEATDGAKLINSDMNFYALSAGNDKLSLDARPLDKEDVIKLGLTTNVNTTYKIKVANFGFSNDVTMYLKDKYMNTLTPVNENMEYSFEVNTDVASQGENRFELVMKQVPMLVLTPSFEVTITPNPVRDQMIINYSIPENGQAIVRILNAEGKAIKTANLGTVNQMGREAINIKELAAGVYTVEMTIGKQRVTKQIVKL